MQRVLVVVVLLVASLASLASAANILDLIYRDVSAVATAGIPNLEKRNEHTDDVNSPVEGTTDDANNPEQLPAEEKSCDCDGLECKCCVDFNITFIDLGGPGCVKLKYISQEQGVLLNVSYGNSLLRSSLANGPQPASTCVSMLGQLAAVCARFINLTPYEDGLQGCLKLEPKLLGDVQTQFNIGCFTMNADGMQLDENATPPPPPSPSTTTVSSTGDVNQAEATTDENPTNNLNEEEILAAVNESAQKGLAFFQNWLGIDFGASSSANGTKQEEQPAEQGGDGDGEAAAKHIEETTTQEQKVVSDSMST